MTHDRSTGTRINNPDFLKFAESFGIKAYRPQTVNELHSNIEESIKSGEMRFIEIPVDPSVNTDLTERLSKYWR
jgi:acetolactate synthase-1/2/3 large subunit